MFLKRYHRGVGLVLVSSEASASAIDLGHYQTEVGAQVDEGEGGEERAICHLQEIGSTVEPPTRDPPR